MSFIWLPPRNSQVHGGRNYILFTGLGIPRTNQNNTQQTFVKQTPLDTTHVYNMMCVFIGLGYAAVTDPAVYVGSNTTDLAHAVTHRVFWSVGGFPPCGDEAAESLCIPELQNHLEPCQCILLAEEEKHTEEPFTVWKSGSWTGIHRALLELSQEAARGLGEEPRWGSGFAQRLAISAPGWVVSSLPTKGRENFTLGDKVYAQRNHGQCLVYLRNIQKGLGQCFLNAGLLTVVMKSLSLVVP